MPAVGKRGEIEGADTPLLKQYKALKAAYPYAILFFRLGDFYEMFGEDAQTASPILGVLLTKRQGLPMCGIPYHSYANYLAKLLKAGYKVAIADQVEDPAQAKGIVKRQVTRLVTPGTVVEEDLLPQTGSNYLVVLELDTIGWGLACVDVSTGEFWATQALSDHGHQHLYATLAKLDPAELIAPARAVAELKLKHALGPKVSLSDWTRSGSESGDPAAWENEVSWGNRPLALKAALKARSYVAATQSHLGEMPAPVYRDSLPEMQLDDAAIHTLELVSSYDGDRQHTLWSVLDRTHTPMGSRRLKRWILHPSTDLREIERRLHCVGELVDKSDLRAKLRAALREDPELIEAAQRSNLVGLIKQKWSTRV